MAEFCSQCETDGNWDIDLLQIALELKKGYSIPFLCEGCNGRALYKDEQGLLYLAKKVEDKIELFKTNLEELQL